MPTKENSAGKQQPYDENTGRYSNSSSDKSSKIIQLKEQMKEAKSIFERGRINRQIEFLESGFDTEEEFLEDKKKKQEEQERQTQLEIQKRREAQKLKEEEYLKSKELESNVSEDKKKQFDIIQKNNPMTDDYHVGIRSPRDIKTFDEIINNEESFQWGDFSKEDAKEALREGFITVYSSYPIRQGVFISTSLNQSKDYAGGGKIYSQKVPLKDVAWINGDEGQFAKVETEEEKIKRIFGI